MEDFTFKIGLSRAGEASSSPTEIPKVALVRDVLQALLETVVLTVHGAEAAVDGFRFVGEDALHPIWPATP